MVNHIHLLETILYVNNQETSTQFYESLFRKKADLYVPGMTEFVISSNCKIGLMPNDGIAKILQDKTPNPSSGSGIPRCELYFYVDNILQEYENGLQCGAKVISPILERNWGDTVCYFADPDGHIIAFATKNKLA
jgi:lactoylglutathione lyase